MVNRDYEALLIVRADLTEEEIEKEIDGIVDLIKSEGGTIIEDDRWGKKRLAYLIKKQRYGFYTLLRFTSNSSTPEKINRQLRFNENILKGLIVIFDGSAGRKSADDLRRESERAATKDEKDERVEAVKNEGEDKNV